MVANFAVVTDLYQIIDLHTATNDGVIDGTTIDHRAGANGYVVANAQPAKLGDGFKMPLFIGCKAKTIRTQHDSRMHATARSYTHIWVDGHVGENVSVRTNDRVVPDRTVGLNNGVRRHLHARLDNHVGTNMRLRVNDRIAGDYRTGMNTRLERGRMFEKLRCTGEGEIGLGDDKTRCWTICRIFCPQNYRSRSSVGKH